MQKWFRKLFFSFWMGTSAFLLGGTLLYSADIALTWDPNSEPALAGYKAYYGTASRTYGVPIDLGNQITYTFTGLAPGTYYFTVTAYDNVGNESTYSNEVSQTISTPDTTPPVISAVQVTNVTSAGAMISWLTNEHSDTQVEYGVTTAYGTSTTLNTASVMGHSQQLSGLTSGRLYNFRVKSRDAAGNLAVSGNFTFTTTVSCSFAILPVSQAFSAAAATGSVAVTTSNGCTWSAAGTASWISITSGSNGSGSGTVNYSIATNPSTSSRTATLTIAGQTFTVTQAGIACTYAISPTSQSFNQNAGTGNVAVTAQTGCSWTASSAMSWVTIGSGANGTGNGTVAYSVAANASTTSRTGTLTVAGQTFTVTQAGAACTYTISPTNSSLNASAATGTVSVTAADGCNWTAASTAGWITIGSGGSGSGNGAVSYSVAASNTSSPRSGTLTIAGQTFTVTQAGAPCNYSLSQSVLSFGANAGTGNLVVSAPSGCSWTAVSAVSWITISSGTEGSGTGAMNYSVAANIGASSTSSSRTGNLTVAGNTLAITQSGISCVFSMSPPTNLSFAAAGGSGNITLAAPSNCSWSAASTVDWMTFVSASGTGSSVVNYSVVPNTTANSRVAILTVAEHAFTITQAGKSCTYSISSAERSFAGKADTGSVAVSASNDCSWTAESRASWITIASGISGSGSGTVNYAVSANTTGEPRTGTLTIAGETFAVTQSSGDCTALTSASSQSFDEGAGNGSVTVTAADRCGWAATSTVDWIKLSTESGTGSGIVGYSVAANATNSPRTGVLIIAGQKFTVNQAAPACASKLSKSGQFLQRNAGTGQVEVMVPSGCQWTAAASASWITISSGSAGQGSGTVVFSVAPNHDVTSRTGMLVIGRETFTVAQAGSHTSYLAQFVQGAGWVSSLVVTNPSATVAATGFVSILDDQGQLQAVSFNSTPPENVAWFTIPPLGSATFTTPASGELVVGSAKITSNTPVSGTVKYSSPSLGTVGVGESSSYRASMTPVVRLGNRGINTGIAISNTQDREVELVMELRDLNGRQFSGGSGLEKLPPHGHLAKFIDQLFPNADTTNFQGTLSVRTTTADGAVATTGIRVGPVAGELTTLPVVPLEPVPTTRELFFAQFVAGSDWTTSLYLANPSELASMAELSFYDDDGKRLGVSVNGDAASDAIAASLRPQGSAILSTDGRGNLVSGSARVSTDNAVGGVLTFASPLGITGVAASLPTEGFITPLTRSVTDELTTGVAIASVGSPVRLRLTLRNQNGEAVAQGQTTIELAANGHLAKFLEQLFPNADTREFQGTLTVNAEGGNIVGTAIQMGSKVGEFTTLPVTPLR